MAAPTRESTSAEKSTPVYRTDLDGLRGIAIALVACFHVWFGKVSGGVDVFLTLSGYFFIGSLLRHTIYSQQIHVTWWETVNPWPRLKRLLRRLLPALLTVLLAVFALTTLVMPDTRWQTIGGELIASGLYYQNWHLALNSQDYLAASAANSPLQHIWSMSVQGQFFLVTLLTALAIAFLIRLGAKAITPLARPGTIRLIVGLALLAVAAVSFYWADMRMGVNQAWNYYDTLARLWEPLAGGLLAVWLPRVRITNFIRNAVTLSALGLIVSCGWWIDGVNAYPGPWALVPVGATLAIIWAGATDVQRVDPATGQSTPMPVVNQWLASRWPVWLGTVAYSLYLWHWPLLIFYLAWRDQNEANLVEGTGILAVSLLLAWLTKRYVEDPLRGGVPKRTKTKTAAGGATAALGAAPGEAGTNAPAAGPMSGSDTDAAPDTGSAPATTASGRATPTTIPAAAGSAPTSHAKRRSPARASAPYVAIVTTVLVIATAAAGTAIQLWDRHVDGLEVDTTQLDPKEYPGGRALLHDLPVPAMPPQPSPLEVEYDYPETSTDGFMSSFEDNEIRVGQYGDLDADRTIALIGGSHSEMWITALNILGQRNGFKVTTYLKMGCPISTDQNPTIPPEGIPYPACYDWGQRALAQVIEDAPDAVFTTSTRPARDEPGDRLPEDYIPIFEELMANGIDIIGMRDTPWPPIEGGTPACLADGGDAQSCGFPREIALKPQDPAIPFADANPQFHRIDLTGAVCTADFCPAIVGNILVYKDFHHLSATFVRSLTDDLEAQMAAELPWTGPDAE